MLRLVCKRRLCFQLLRARSRATAPAAPGAVRGLSLRHYRGIKYGSLLELCLARILENFQERKTKLYFDKGVRKVGTDLHEVTSRGIRVCVLFIVSNLVGTPRDTLSLCCQRREIGTITLG